MAYQGLMFLEIFESRAKTEIFLNERNNPQPQLLNTEWLWKLVFADILMFLNEFNLKLQG